MLDHSARLTAAQGDLQVEVSLMAACDPPFGCSFVSSFALSFVLLVSSV
jgi:hypothetical protein